MRILFVCPRFHTNMIGWIKTLKSNNHSVFIDVINKGNLENYEDLKPYQIEISNFSQLLIKYFGGGGIGNVRAFPSFIKYFLRIRKLKPDHIIVRDINRWFSIIACIISLILNIKLTIYSQTILFKRYSLKRILITKFILFIFKCNWITPIKGNRLDFNYKPKGMYFIPFAIFIDKNRSSQNKTLRFITIGKFEKRKNFILLLKALLLIKEKLPLFKLEIIGEVSKKRHFEYYNEVKKYILINKLDNIVNINMNIPYNEMHNFYSKSDINILPATNEPASVSILEGMGYGLPAICSSNCGTRFYIEDKINGKVFKDNDFNDLSRKILEIISSNKLDDLKSKTFLYAKKNLSYENFYKNFEKKVI